jgi:hypothetical protein
MFRLALLKSAVALSLSLGLSAPCWAKDSLLFINHINHVNHDRGAGATSGPIELGITVDGHAVGDNCAAKSTTLVLCEAQIAPGKHSVVAQIKGGKSLARTIDVRAEEGAMHWAGDPDDLRLWCVSVTKSRIALMSKSACWDIENGR